jgi:hypothetical protein
MTAEEYVGACLLATGVNGGEAIFIGQGPEGVFSRQGAQVVCRQYDSKETVTVDGKTFSLARVQVWVAAKHPEVAIAVAISALAALRFRGPHNPVPGVSETFPVHVVSGPARIGEANGLHFATMNVEVLV